MIGIISDILKKHGAVAVGFAKADLVDDCAWDAFLDWVSLKRNAGMKYMENHLAIRRDPRLLLEGAKSIISLAFPFKPSQFRETEKGMIACYAYGLDYHDVIRQRVTTALTEIREAFGGDYRICVDSAPIMERYWAVKAGIGEIGDNGSVNVPGIGNMVFLAEIVTTLELSNGNPASKSDLTPIPNRKGDEKTCQHCGICRKGCPSGALLPGGTVNSNRCLSYLSIEHRGEWNDSEALAAMETETGKNLIFGCDRCLRICPLNKETPPTAIPEFFPSKEIWNLTKECVAELTQEEFSRIFKGSPIKRCKLAGLRRNVGIKT